MTFRRPYWWPSFKLFRACDISLMCLRLPPSALLLTESHLSSTIPNCTALAWQRTCWTVGAIGVPSSPKSCTNQYCSRLLFLDCPYACRVKSFCFRLTISSLVSTTVRPRTVPLPCLRCLSGLTLASCFHSGARADPLKTTMRRSG